ncbi:nucleoside/nucleotide kinase family protein [Larsenimonas rhizosphaerae]|uniref:Nucleoside/nucleotide kinase family protein n=1 Tax=Larsenimonas rhizosphaerae TaxID=2944682 RepID=A0AA42CXM1_9GAMM|nr:nucleoside/nucleotide kinase family protein [Larsenimonas rhizosphaerae]MCM2129375.1 nucleoside/nucleotide kinase family protein [Larsenimonas rhizosphaerae]MCX2524030.1 nucleoside/nucleotide kinase family protein [Larsenimonas rhizosphaerae]
MATSSPHATPSVPVDDALLDAARRLIHRQPRSLLGIVGAPGCGKSTLAAALTEALGPLAVQVPMDGFHLSNQELARLERAGRKGAPDTFDASGYRDLLYRLRTPHVDNEVIYAPDFYREIEEPIAASIPVLPEARLVITEGNYLLLQDAPWPQVAELLDEVWYLDVDNEQRETWLIERHMRFGRTEAEAKAWVASTDRPNAERIALTRHRADRIVRWDDTGLREGTL